MIENDFKDLSFPKLNSSQNNFELNSKFVKIYIKGLKKQKPVLQNAENLNQRVQKVTNIALVEQFNSTSNYLRKSKMTENYSKKRFKINKKFM